MNKAQPYRDEEKKEVTWETESLASDTLRGLAFQPFSNQRRISHSKFNQKQYET